MSQKLDLDILFPPTREHHTFAIPPDVTAREAATLVAQAFEVQYPSLYTASENPTFMIKSSGALVDTNALMGELGLVNGDRLVVL